MRYNCPLCAAVKFLGETSIILTHKDVPSQSFKGSGASGLIECRCGQVWTWRQGQILTAKEALEESPRVEVLPQKPKGKTRRRRRSR